MTSTMTRLMTVGELSRRTGVSIKNLRLYTDWGLIHTVGRSQTNYRLFDTDALSCVQTIGRLRELGLTVAEIRELVTEDTLTGAQLARRLRDSRRRITARIAELRQTLHRIDEFEADHRARLNGDTTLCDAL